jgi:hypothetical protein
MSSRSVFFSGFNWQFCNRLPPQKQRFLYERITKHSKCLTEASIRSSRDVSLLERHFANLKSLEIQLNFFEQGVESFCVQLAEAGDLERLSIDTSNGFPRPLPGPLLSILARISDLNLDSCSDVATFVALTQSCRNLRRIRALASSLFPDEMAGFGDALKSMCRNNADTIRSVEVGFGDKTWQMLFPGYPIEMICPADNGWTLETLKKECIKSYHVNLEHFGTCIALKSRNNHPRDIVSSMLHDYFELKPAQEQHLVEFFKFYYGSDVTALDETRVSCLMHSLKMASLRMRNEISDTWVSFVFEVLESILTMPLSPEVSSSVMTTLYAHMTVVYEDPESAQSFSTMIMQWVESHPKILLPLFTRKLIKSPSTNVDSVFLNPSNADWLDRVGFRLDEVLHYKDVKEIVAVHLMFSRPGRVQVLARLPQFDVSRLKLLSGATIWQEYWKRFDESWNLNEADLSTLLGCHVEKKLFDEPKLAELLVEGLQIITRERHWFSKLFNRGLAASIDCVAGPFAEYMPVESFSVALFQFVSVKFGLDLPQGASDYMLIFANPESSRPSWCIAAAMWYDLIRTFTPTTKSGDILSRLNFIAKIHERAPEFIVKFMKKKEDLPIPFADSSATPKLFRQALETNVKSSGIKIDGSGCSVM